MGCARVGVQLAATAGGQRRADAGGGHARVAAQERHERRHVQSIGSDGQRGVLVGRRGAADDRGDGGPGVRRRVRPRRPTRRTWQKSQRGRFPRLGLPLGAERLHQHRFVTEGRFAGDDSGVAVGVADRGGEVASVPLPGVRSGRTCVRPAGAGAAARAASLPYTGFNTRAPGVSWAKVRG